jgi:hypothetical protein
MPAGGESAIGDQGAFDAAVTRPSTPDRETEIRQAIEDGLAKDGISKHQLAYSHPGNVLTYAIRVAAAREAALQARIDKALARCDHWSGSGNAVYRLAASEIRAALAGDTTEAGRG